MAKYPLWTVGKDVSAQNLADGIPDIYVKSGPESATSDTTLSNDSELSGIPLGVGTWYICLSLFVSTPASATPDIKTQWAFTGTWNTPLRMCQGPGSTNTAGPETITVSKSGALAVNANSVYGLAATSAYALAVEKTYAAVVTVAGNLSLQWAQNTSDANATIVQAGSTFEVRQIA